MFTVDSVTIFSFSLNFDRWMVTFTCPLLLGIYKPLMQVTCQVLKSVYAKYVI